MRCFSVPPHRAAATLPSVFRTAFRATACVPGLEYYQAHSAVFGVMDSRPRSVHTYWAFILMCRRAFRAYSVGSNIKPGCPGYVSDTISSKNSNAFSFFGKSLSYPLSCRRHGMVICSCACICYSRPANNGTILLRALYTLQHNGLSVVYLCHWKYRSISTGSLGGIPWSQ